MVFSRLRDWLRSWLDPGPRPRVHDTPFPSEWEPFVARQPFLGRLPEDLHESLRHVLRVLVEEKEWEGCGGLKMTAEIQVVVAAQAARLLLGLRHDYFRNVGSILVYPASFVNPIESAKGDDTMSVGSARHGEAWVGGPVILAWDQVLAGARDPKDGRNLVLHEFAHKLDFLDDFANGTPPLGAKASYRAWKQIMTTEYARLRADVDAGRRTTIDPYGATNAAEFFAVATETFFEQSVGLRKRHASLYGLLRDYYGQDPAAIFD